MKKIFSMILVMLMALSSFAQLPSSFPPKSYPASIFVVTDPGVAKYWDVKRIMYLGPGNGGHKFRIYGKANADHRAASVEMFYIRHDDKLQSAGAYVFPAVKVGEAFNFDIVSAFVGYSPKSFLGFMIKDDLFPAHQEVSQEISENSRIGETHITSDVRNERISTVNQDTTDNNIYRDVDESASFPGGTSALSKWLSSNIRYPEAAEKQNIQGKVVVNFIIEKNGAITQARIKNSVNVDLDKEALRVVNRMPKWNPGKKNGNPVRSYFNLPINFRLQLK